MNKTIQQTIGEIQDNHCRCCNYGKALIALLNLQKSLGQKIQPKPAEKRIKNSTGGDAQSKAERKREAQRRWYEKQKAKKPASQAAIAPPTDRAAAAPDKKVCTRCNQEKSLEQFHVNKQGKYGRDSACAACKNADVQRIKEEKRKGRQSGQDDKPHVCDKCGKRFMALGSLIAHKKDNCPMRKTV